MPLSLPKSNTTGLVHSHIFQLLHEAGEGNFVVVYSLKFAVYRLILALSWSNHKLITIKLISLLVYNSQIVGGSGETWGPLKDLEKKSWSVRLITLFNTICALNESWYNDGRDLPGISANELVIFPFPYKNWALS